MPVYEVAAIYTPNGNRRSRPIVADDADHAKAIAEVDWEIAENDPQFTWDIYCRPDEDGRMERLLRDAERRRLEDEYYAMPAQKTRGRYGRLRR